MPCSSCIPNVVVNYESPFGSTQTTPCSNTCTSGDLQYKGADLTCAGIVDGDTYNTALQKIDTKLCAVLGDYSTYDTHCLTGITNEKQFVEAITDQFCTLKSDYDTFTTATYPGDIVDINTTIDTINSPGINKSCTAISILSTDKIKDILVKLSDSVCSISDLSSVNWDNCYAVSPEPTTISQGFNTVLNQICTLKSSISSLGVLPVFDNSTSCIAGSASDSLEDTISLIKTKLCSLPTLDINSLTWDCTTKPTTSNSADLQKSLQAILSAISSLKRAVPVFDTNFQTTPNGCSGTKVSLSNSISLSDKYVAATSTDINPSTLEDKLDAGIGISLDYSDPTKVTISSTATSDNDKVKAYGTDTSSGYLSDKIEGSADDDITIELSHDGDKVKVSADYDPYNLFKTLLTTLDDLPTDDPLFKLFCKVKNKCATQCNPPTAITVNYVTT